MTTAPAAESQPGVIVLGSRSPRRLELLSLLVGRDRIIVRPPLDPNESGFDGLRTLAEIADRLKGVARVKNADVSLQPPTSGSLPPVSAVITADTVIVAEDENGEPVVLGQPPADDSWREVVREWFERYLLRRPHAALTAVCVSTPDGRRREQVARTNVAFRTDAVEWVEWYLDSGEPRGKAGGYALQSAGSLFVEALEGSPSNVVGLPLRETAEMLRELRCL